MLAFLLVVQRITTRRIRIMVTDTTTDTVTITTTGMPRTWIVAVRVLSGEEGERGKPANAQRNH